MPLRENDERRIGEPETEIPVPLDDPARRPQLVTRQALHDEGRRDDVIEESQLDVRAQAPMDQVVRLREDQFARYDGLSLRSKDLDHFVVTGLRSVRL